MDKQREEFEATSPFSFYVDKVERCGERYKPVHYKDFDYAEIMSFGWLAWQQAQKMAVPKLSDKVVCVIEREVENQLIASGIDADPFRLDGEKIFNAIIEAWEKK